MKTLIVLAIAFCIVLIGFAGIGIKVLLRRNGEFKRHCSGHDPYTGASNGCACATHSQCQCATRKATAPATALMGPIPVL